MCGIVGLISTEKDKIFLKTRIELMKDLISHRGPDGEGIWLEQDDNICLGHRRLAIIDTKHGHQPLQSQDGDLVIVFNGEIYNYIELREELIRKGHPIISHSDTEVLLYAYREWGDDCLKHLLGMFAFAIWDRKKKRLFCARDRIGIKPFYYFWDRKNFAFSSEIKSILASSFVKAEPNPQGLQDYITFQFCLGDKTMFKDIYKLEPGWFMVVQYGNEELTINRSQYWDLNYSTDTVHDEKWFNSKLLELLENSVAMHLRSDVPLGAHLSGGLDSSTVASLATRFLSNGKINTFTGAFSDGIAYDETRYAKSVANHIAAQYNEVYIEGNDFPYVFPKLIYYMDEPAAGPGLVPQYYVSKLASKKVKVVLGGQGGDEVFIGYARYLIAYLEKCVLDSVNGSEVNDNLSLNSIAKNLGTLKPYIPLLKTFWKNGLFETWDKRYFQLIDRREGYKDLYSDQLFNTDYSSFESFCRIFNRSGILSLTDKMSYFDIKGSLPALLQVEDRTSMAASIESRVPLLDHRVLEFMATVPEHIKFKNGDTKHLFKNVIKTILPKEIYERKDKMGFPTPLEKWVKNEAREFVLDTLLSNSAKQRGIYNIQKLEHAIGNEPKFGRVVWGILSLETWYKTFIDKDISSR
ncbi:asparagine synthase (glutamine-hydrolyzing) [Candidatus Megaera polyxenophila]|uniref:asparagine synthase (glutamine-hydrolyzing) n=1 Tax=Candidatus Megaera polyxenophila TaxID=988779 RepID=UPI00249F3511|nr:asparagine synthase (glutamine-hydrolyzing) [Candidatus Megaera polyxenophila]